MIRGYHEYLHIWDAVVGETLLGNHEVGNVHDPYAVSIKKGSENRMCQRSLILRHKLRQKLKNLKGQQ